DSREIPTRLAVRSRSALARRAAGKSSSLSAERNSNQRPRRLDRVAGGGSGETRSVGRAASVSSSIEATCAAAGSAIVSRNRIPAALLCMVSARGRRRRNPACFHIGHPELVQRAGQEILLGARKIVPGLAFEK